MTNFKIIEKRKIWLSISSVLFILFGTALIIWGLKFGIDFTGGSILEVKIIGQRPSVTEVEDKLKSDAGVGALGSLIVQPADQQNLILRFQETTEEKHIAVIKALNQLAESKTGTEQKFSVEELSFDAVGPSVGQELRQKSIYSIIVVLLAIIIYISYSFRKVSRPVASWKYGLASIIALVHDAIITLGIFAVLGKYYGIEINTPFVAAILTVIGYSNHDTIVVFDRIRENLPKSDKDFEGMVNDSLNQTLVRSLNTSITSLLALTAILIFGGASIKSFVLALTIGIAMGTYSSIFVASPLLVVWEKMKK
jgi:preprotein translocase subunit SecF